MKPQAPVPLVVYDDQVFTKQRVGGISRYVYELASRVAKSGAFDARVVAPLHVNEYLRSAESGLVWGRPMARIRGTGRLVRLLRGAASRAFYRTSKPAIVHETYYSRAATGPTGPKRVLTVHDMIHEIFGDRFFEGSQLSGAKELAARRADRIICVSHNTKEDLVSLFGIDPDKISVVHLACSFSPSVASAAALIDGPYILYVGSRAGYKNFGALLEAYASSESLRGLRLVCGGGGPFNAAEIERMRTLGIDRGRVHQVSGDDRVLQNLYENASVFVYPSLYEGFGIPPLEAMTLGCPVVCSRAGSLPEVVADAADMFDPTDIESIAESLERVLDSPSWRHTLIQKGRERASQFSWDTCASETMEIYSGLLS